MSAMQVLDSSNLHHYQLWLKFWSAQSEQEILAHPEYVKLFCRPCDIALCAVMETAGEIMMFPFILRPLSEEKWIGDRSQYRDIINQYGYGGMICSDWTGTFSADSGRAKRFWEEFDDWAIQHNVVSCFVRFSPFACYVDDFSGKVECAGENVIRSLEKGICTIWSEFDHKVRTNIRRAERNGLVVEVDTRGSRMEDFKRIYYSTMERRHAQGQYFFPEEFFSAITEKLTGSYVFFHTLYGNQVVSTELVLLSRDHMYSFLGGTDGSFLKLYPNEIIKDAAIRWGIEHGKKTYVLGGGHNGQSGLLRYKKSFAQQGIIPYLVGKKIYNETVYKELCEMRARYETADGNTICFDNGFFPAYRVSVESSKDIADEVHHDGD